MIYIVLGPGRTGSNLICHMLGSHGLEPSGMLYAARTEDDTQQSLDNAINFLTQSKRWRTANIVIHTHDPDVIKKLNVDPSHCVLIISKRNNLFEMIMSHIVTYVTKQWSDYKDLQPVPTEFSSAEFIKWYYGFRNWYKDIDLSVPYNKVVEVYYEDIQDTQHGFTHLANLLSVGAEFKELPRSNPHRYQDWISNWKQLYDIYNVVHKQS